MNKSRIKIMAKALILASAALLIASSPGLPDALSEQPETIVLFGDSITARWPWHLPGYDIINEGVDGNTIQDLLDRIFPVIAHEPDTLFLMIGVNDILTGYYGEHPG
jgi:lysophospholipase L1-like esterase